MTTVSAYEVILPGNALVLAPEARYVSETSTGLSFSPEMPIEVWGELVTRLQRQQKLIDWALADAINFGEQAYGEDYAQWIDETGLSKRTLQNIARIGRAIPAARRRAEVSFSHHAEVITLPVADQERLLDAAERAGMTRYDLRDAVRERKRELAGGAQTIDGDVIDAADVLGWVPMESDLTDQARAALEQHAPQGRLRMAYVTGWLRAMVWAEQRDAFREGSWRL